MNAGQPLPDFAEMGARIQAQKDADAEKEERERLEREAAIERATKRAWKGIYPFLFRKSLRSVAEASHE